jgi:hypothetical protein
MDFPKKYLWPEDDTMMFPSEAEIFFCVIKTSYYRVYSYFVHLAVESK